MRTPEALRQLGRLHSLGTMREQRAQAALQRALAHHEEQVGRQRATEQALHALADEREALFERHKGLMKPGDLFQLRRRESILESQRIDLMLDLTRLRQACEQALAATHCARLAVTNARRRRDKMAHVVGLFRQEARSHEQMKEEAELEEYRYEN